MYWATKCSTHYPNIEDINKTWTYVITCHKYDIRYEEGKDKQLFITQNVEHSARGSSGISKWEESGLDQWRQERRCHLDFGLERSTGILYIIPISTTSGEKKISKIIPLYSTKYVPKQGWQEYILLLSLNVHFTISFSVNNNYVAIVVSF